MKKSNTSTVTNGVLILYTVTFFTIWTLHEFFTKPIISEVFVGLSGELLRSIIKIIIWVVPCIFLLMKYEGKLFVSFKNMFKNKVNWIKTTPVFLLFTAYILIGSYMQYGNIQIRESFNPIDLIGTVLLVGITEELVFRGWLLNAFLIKTNKWTSILINALLFLAIHFPVWIKTGVFSEAIFS